ncbi:MAG: sigma-70 family RNA polymerase sigma factor [Minicystis sp.]
MLAQTTKTARRTKKLAPAILELRRDLAALRPELFGRALRMARSAQVAEDLVQDTIERALRFETTYQPGTNVRAWANQILFSVFMTRCRRGRRERSALNVLSTDPCAWTLPERAGPEMLRLSPPVEKALKSLPIGFRKTVVLIDIEELPYKAVAKRMRVPVGTVMSRLHRARRMLAETIREGSEACERQAA